MLEDYIKKRDFKKTPEPTGKTKRTKAKELVFVVQKHNARRLHHDVRLELDGVLISWAVPKGPSLSPADKRLAVMTEDHPFEYRKFEGVIPTGEYGAGEMIIWDQGTYVPKGAEDFDSASKLMHKGIKDGKITVEFKGIRLKGEWAFVRTADKNWLMIKHKDEYADAHRDLASDDSSVVSDHTLQSLKEISDSKSKKKKEKPPHRKLKVVSSTKRDANPSAITPMLAAVESVKTISKQVKKEDNAKADTKPTQTKTEKQVTIDPMNEELKEQIVAAQKTTTLEIDGHKVNFTSLDKALWPATETSPPVTKKDYLIYFLSVSDAILPLVKDRPLTLLRFPNGINGMKFYQRHWQHKLPEFVETVKFYSEQNNKNQDYLLCNNLATLLWLAQIADLEIHVAHTRPDPEPDGKKLSTKMTDSAANIESSIMNYPDFVVIDLDPYLYSGKEKKGDEPALHQLGFRKTCEVAFWFKDLLDGLKLKSFIKTSGRTGIHIYLPIVRNIDYDSVREIAKTLSAHILEQHKDEVTMEWAVVKRTGKVFLDHNMNARSKSLACAYSPRIAPEASVSVPLKWDELDKIYPTDFTIWTVPHRLSQVGDLWKDILNSKNDMTSLFRKRAASD